MKKIAILMTILSLCSVFVSCSIQKKSILEGVVDEDFAPVNVLFYKHKEDIKYEYDFKQHIPKTKVYINGDTGNDEIANGEKDSPFKTFSAAMDFMSSSNINEYTMVACTYRFDCEYMRFDLNNQKIAIVPEKKGAEIVFSSHIKDINWQSDTMGIYYADVKAFGIFDLRNVDENFVPKPFEYVSSAEECANKPGTFFSDKKRIYVHTLDQKSPDDLNYVVGGDIALIKASLFEQSAVYLENCSFIGTHDSQLTDIRSNSENESIFVANRCRFIGGNQIPLDTQTGNALAVRSVKTTMMFNCIAAYSPRDGFNYHYNEIQEDKRRECLVVEYKCLAYNNGLISDILSSNATTAHEGICILRVGSVGYNTKGPVLADVNGCYSISIACKMSNSVTDNDGSFFFSNTGTPPKSGKAVLIDCVSDSSPYDINGDTEIEIILSNFTGSKTKEGLNITHIE